MDEKRKIVVGLDKGCGVKIAQALGVSTVMVSQSVRGHVNTVLQRRSDM